jgi:hypothetical protein
VGVVVWREVNSFHLIARKGYALASAIFLAEREVRLAQCGLMLLLLFFARRLGVKYGDLAVGIILGFGMYTIASLLTGVAMSHTGISHTAMRWVKSLAYVLACLIWLAYALTAKVKKEPVPSRL